MDNTMNASISYYLDSVAFYNPNISYTECVNMGNAPLYKIQHFIVNVTGVLNIVQLKNPLSKIVTHPPFPLV